MVATRLLLLCGRAPVATAAARSLGAQPHFRAAAAGTTGARLVRSFSLASGSGGGNDNDDGDLSASDRLNGDAAVNGDVNPFERLLLHSQQFRQKIADAEKDGVEFAFVEEKEDDDEEETRGETPDADDDSSSDSDDDDDGVDVAADRFSKRSETRSSRRPGAGAFNVDRASRTARSVKRRILNAPEDELDYEHELSKLQYSRAKERKYQQLIHREQDKDRVCRNCGERGHVAKHCLLPIICSNCGGIGHRMRDCIYPDYTSEDEDAERFGKKKKKQQKAESAAEKQRMGKRYDKFKEEFDSQIEEYLEDSAVAAEKRNKRKAEKLAQKQQQASQDFDPVIG